MEGGTIKFFKIMIRKSRPYGFIIPDKKIKNFEGDIFFDMRTARTVCLSGKSLILGFGQSRQPARSGGERVLLNFTQNKGKVSATEWVFEDEWNAAQEASSTATEQVPSERPGTIRYSVNSR